MSASVQEIIGQIVHPRPTAHPDAPVEAPSHDPEPFQAILGRIIAPSGVAAMAAEVLQVSPAPEDPTVPAPTA